MLINSINLWFSVLMSNYYNSRIANGQANLKLWKKKYEKCQINNDRQPSVKANNINQR